MYYSREIVDEVLARNDIVDVIGSYLSLKKSGSEYMCCCPFHQEKSPSFSVSRKKQMFYCFGCHVGGSALHFLMKYDNLSYTEAVKNLAERANFQLPEVEYSQEEKQKYDRKTKLWEVNKAAAGYFHYLLTKTDRGKTGYAYFREKRRFTDETIHNFALGYADVYRDDLYRYLKKQGYSDQLIRDAGLADFDERYGPHDKFWSRVMVPILDINGKCIAFGGRVLGDGKPKYLNTRETEVFDKSRNLFALNIARRSRRRGLILCEGYMDVITQHQAGFDNAVASLGTAFTQGHVSILRRYTKEVYLAYDSDHAGRDATKKAILLLRAAGLAQRVIDLSPYKDPDEFLAAEGPEAYEQRIRDAIPGRMFEVRELAKEYRLDDPEEKSGFIRKTAAILAGIEDIPERSSYCETIARTYGLDEEVLKQEVTRIGLLGLAEKGDRQISRNGGLGEDTRREGEIRSRDYYSVKLKNETGASGGGTAEGGQASGQRADSGADQYPDQDLPEFSWDVTDAMLDDISGNASAYADYDPEAGLPPEAVEEGNAGGSGVQASGSRRGGAGESPAGNGGDGSGLIRKTPGEIAQEYLLTWMVNRPELFRKLSGYISEEDFTGPIRPVAGELFRQFRETGDVQPAKVLSTYADDENSSEVAGMLSREFPFETDTDAMEKALTELVRKIRLQNVDDALKRGEGSRLELAKKKREIQKIVVRLT